MKIQIIGYKFESWLLLTYIFGVNIAKMIELSRGKFKARLYHDSAKLNYISTYIAYNASLDFKLNLMN